MQKNKELKAPYKCDPTDPDIPCRLNINPDFLTEYSKRGKLSYLETPCKCSMANTTIPNEGFCGSVIGTKVFTRQIKAVKNVID